MAIYLCPICDEMIDDDYFPGELLHDKYVCPDCYEDAMEEESE